MKRFTDLAVLLITFIAVMAFSSHRRTEEGTDRQAVQDTTFRYADGVYEGQSRYSYTDEPYWGKVQITVNNGLFTGIRFLIRDSNLHETFDGAYEKHFDGNPLYIQQSRNDWGGVQAYPKKMMEKQDITRVDAISGATWSYNIFRASVEEALKRAKKP